MSSTQLKRIEKTAKDIDSAVELALAELGTTRDKVTIEVLEEPSKGLFGVFGGKEARVAVALNQVTPVDGAEKFLNDLFLSMGIKANIESTFEDNALSIDLSGDDMGIIIGKRGDTLDALQYLTSLIINKTSDDYIKVTIDTENYREKRRETLENLAMRIASKVSRSGRRFILEPMNPYERRVIHAKLQGHDEVGTYSIGDEPNRKVVVAMKADIRPKK